jgi:hypothetical protein
MPNSYEEKKQAKIKYYKEKSKELENLSNNMYDQAQKLGSVIPFGQPILVGHHSEKGHRNLIKRINNKYEQSFKTQEKAEYYEHKAEITENNNTISSDDPEAITKLEAKLKSLMDNQEFMKKVNAEYRKTQDLNKTSLDAESVKSILHAWEIMPYYSGVPFRSYSLSNNSANIRIVEKRIEQLKARSKDITQEIILNDIKIIDNVEANRIQVFFQGKPSEEIRSKLKKNGFRWSPSIGCWQSYRKQHSLDAAKQIQTE